MLDSRLEMRPKVLVIGSKDHDRADCVDWLHPFPNIEDYDSIIINLQSLTQAVYDKSISKIRGMRESIVTVFSTDREIFCVMNKVVAPSPVPSVKGKRTGIGLVTIDPDYVPTTNYEWLPIRIEIRSGKRGTFVSLSNHRFDKYFQGVDKWNLEIGMLSSSWIALVPIAVNKSRKMIGASLEHIESVHQGAIHLLPPPTKGDTHRAIETLLDLICGEKAKTVPLWRKDIQVPEIKEFEKKIDTEMEVIKEIQERISQLKSQIQELDSYRDLLTETGDDLVSIVKKTLSDIGIKVNKTEKGFPADLTSDNVAIEVTGIKGHMKVSSGKVIQTARFKENYHKGEKIVLIVNTFMNLSLQEREKRDDFTRQAKKYFEASSICCLTTKTLFQLWKDVVSKKRDSKDVRSMILTKNGELTLGHSK